MFLKEGSAYKKIVIFIYPEKGIWIEVCSELLLSLTQGVVGHHVCDHSLYSH